MELADEFKATTVSESSICPNCGDPCVVITKREYDCGDLEGVVEIINRCTSCTFRAADVYPAQGGEPRRSTFKVRCPKDLDVRVVKSSSALVSIPELGVLIEPGPAAKGYVTNVQGVLERVKDVIRTAHSWEESDEGRARCDQRLADLEAITDGTGFTPFRLIIEDIFGNSIIISKKTKTAPLSPEDIERIVSGE